MEKLILPTTYAFTMEFRPSEEVNIIKKQIDNFIDNEVVPLENEHDHLIGEDSERTALDESGKITDEYVDIYETIRKKSAEAGYYTMKVPEEMDGGGLGLLDYLLVVEHVYRRDPRGFHWMVVPFGPMPLRMHDDPHQRKEFFEPWLSGESLISLALTEPDHGNDATWINAKAEKNGDEWIINGTKCFITNSTIADAIIVVARTSGEAGDLDGLSAFIVDKSNPGWTVGKIQRPMGNVKGSAGGVGRLAFNHFEDCVVPESHLIGEEGEGLMETALRDTINMARWGIAAKAVGQGEWMLEQCLDYANDRYTFGKPIGQRQFVKGMLSDMRLEISQTKWAYRHGAWKFDQDEGERWHQSAAKILGSELWTNIADTAIQIHGGAGAMRSLPFEAEFRNGRVTQIYDGTNEIHRNIIADNIL